MRIKNQATVTIAISDGGESKKVETGKSCEVEWCPHIRLIITSKIGNIIFQITKDGQSKGVNGKLRIDSIDGENFTVYCE